MTKTSTQETENGSKIKKIFLCIGSYMPNSNFFVAVATILLVVVGIFGVLVTQRALELSERAWITPIGAQLISPIENGKPLRFILKFINTGRQPARDIEVQFQNSTIDGYDTQTTDLKNIKVAENTACVNLVPKRGRPPMPPTSGNATLAIIEDTIHGQPAFTADDRIIRGDKFYVIHGCLAYEAYEKTRQTAFCYILESTPFTVTTQQPAQITPGTGPGGAVTPNPNPTITLNGRNFSFSTCSMGYDAN